MRAVVAYIPIGREAVERHVGTGIHAFLLASQPQIEFAALTPKGDHVVVNAAGPAIAERDLSLVIERFQGLGLLPPALPDYHILHNVFPTAPARNFYADRVVAVGNTSGLLRPLKGKGLNAGVLTGSRAAKVMLEEGISRRALGHFYRACADLISDYRYGLILRSLFRLSRRLGYLDAVIDLARHDRTLYRVFHTLISGEGSYKQVVLSLAKPTIWPGLARAALGAEQQRRFGNGRQRTSASD
jgi:flavin-dependent dehydrogenase